MGRITASRTQLKGDPKHNSMLAGKFINCLMLDGKKTTAQRVFYDALSEIDRRKESSEHSAIEVFEAAVENVKPQIEVRSKRVGGAAYQVPMQVNKARQQSLAIRWLLMAVREKKGRPTSQKLADDIGRMTDRMETQAPTTQALLRVAEGQERLLESLHENREGEGPDAESRMRLRSIDVQMLRILEEISAGRQETMAEIRTDLAGLAEALKQVGAQEQRQRPIGRVRRAPAAPSDKGKEG